MDKEMDSASVKGKREAARRWANHVTADDQVDVRTARRHVTSSDRLIGAGVPPRSRFVQYPRASVKPPITTTCCAPMPL